jgi:hypothetical protein
MQSVKVSTTWDAPKSRCGFALDSCPKADETQPSRVIPPAAVAERRARSRPQALIATMHEVPILLHSPRDCSQALSWSEA